MRRYSKGTQYEINELLPVIPVRCRSYRYMGELPSGKVKAPDKEIKRAAAGRTGSPSAVSIYRRVTER